ncbi:hypothetical protein [Aeromonas phage AerS_266]|nr:hypothetical protein [Aeromonas phage AerS_266]
MINVSRRLSSNWSKLSYTWGEAYLYPAFNPDNHGALSVSEHKGSDLIEGWPDDEIHVHVTPQEQIFLFKFNEPKKFINPWHNSQELFRTTVEYMNRTLMNLMEFRLGWDGKEEFKNNILPLSNIKPVTVKPSRKTWWVVNTDIMFEFVYATAQQMSKEYPEGSFIQIPVEQIPLLLVDRCQPVHFSVKNKNIHVKIYHLPYLATNWVPDMEAGTDVLFTLPAAAISYRLLDDTTKNLVAGDKLNWGRVLTERFKDYVIISDRQYMDYSKYELIGSEHTHPTF